MMTKTSPSSSKVLVTGGAGFLGTRVVRQLLAAGKSVVALDDLSVGSRVAADVAENPSFEFVNVDLRDRAAVLETFDRTRPTSIFHLAALHFIPHCILDPTRTLEVNVLGTQHVLDACATLDEPPGLIFSSTADVYLPQSEPHREDSSIGPDNVYGLSKLVGEELIKQSYKRGHCSPVIVRLFNLYGSNETNPHVIPEIVAQLRTGDSLRLGNTMPKRDFVYIDDAATAFCRLAECAPVGTMVNVGTGLSYSITEVIETIANILGREIVVEVDQDRFRVSDRPNLQSDPAQLHGIDQNLLRTTLESGLSSLLRDEGLLPS